MTTPSPQQRELLTSLGLTWRATALVILIDHPDGTFDRVEPACLPIWLRGYLQGRSARCGVEGLVER